MAGHGPPGSGRRARSPAASRLRVGACSCGMVVLDPVAHVVGDVVEGGERLARFVEIARAPAIGEDEMATGPALGVEASVSRMPRNERVPGHRSLPMARPRAIVYRSGPVRCRRGCIMSTSVARPTEGPRRIVREKAVRIVRGTPRPFRADRGWTW